MGGYAAISANQTTFSEANRSDFTCARKWSFIPRVYPFLVRTHPLCYCCCPRRILAWSLDQDTVATNYLESERSTLKTKLAQDGGREEILKTGELKTRKTKRKREKNRKHKMVVV